MRSGRKTRPWAWLLFVFSLAGLIGFFIFSQKHFGNWALYFQLEETGWQNHRRYFAILNPLMYLPPVFFEDTIQSLNKAAVTFTAYLLIVLGRAEYKALRNEGGILTGQTLFSRTSFTRILASPLGSWCFSRRGGFFWIAFGMFYIALTGKANSNLDSMLRYTFPSYILLVMQAAELNVLRKERGEPSLFFAGLGSCERRRVSWKFAGALLFGLGFQAWCIYRFVHGHWVA
jgi:hypothetical protein